MIVNQEELVSRAEREVGQLIDRIERQQVIVDRLEAGGYGPAAEDAEIFRRMLADLLVAYRRSLRLSQDNLAARRHL